MNRLKSHFDEHTEKMRETRQGSGGFEYDARQPRLAMEACVRPDNKFRKRTEDAAGYQTKHGDSCSAKRANACPPMYLISIFR